MPVSRGTFELANSDKACGGVVLRKNLLHSLHVVKPNVDVAAVQTAKLWDGSGWKWDGWSGSVVTVLSGPGSCWNSKARPCTVAGFSVKGAVEDEAEAFALTGG
ncbi:hypothetical protein HPB48_016698 [Haemaphysalis longicornis]|uniref:Uncharacterized protein n=1 Tax=Haemaphysalis longicornis TaxID=44386 RepID=A0A9J6GAS9_HAELO|nr:hypothetical protein HPB48_016698 [Haemaphysalis longicornis]